MDIVDIELNKVYDRLAEKGLKLVLSNDARGFIIDKGEAGDGLDYGARPLRRSVERYIEDPLAEELLRGTFEGKNVVTIEVTEVGDQKQLKFESSYEEVPEATDGSETVAVGSSDKEEPAAE